MALDFILLLLGGVLLYFGAEWLVQGAAGIALRMGVSPLLVGLTIVSYATSAPELAVSVSAAVRGDSSLVLGNVIGSNIANIGLILGLTILISPPKSDGSMAGKELVFLFLSTLAVPLFLLNGTLDKWEGAIFLVLSVVFTAFAVLWSKKRPVNLDDVPTEERRGNFLLTCIGLAGVAVLIAGGELFVIGAVGLAEALGVDQRVIGLTVVAFGTSVPELAASLVAALRGHSDIALGNVVGSNIFNILLVLGAASALTPLRMDLSTMKLDLIVLGCLTLGALVVLSRKRTISRIEGALLSACYLGFMMSLVIGIP